MFLSSIHFYNNAFNFQTFKVASGFADAAIAFNIQVLRVSKEQRNTGLNWPHKIKELYLLY